MSEIFDVTGSHFMLSTVGAREDRLGVLTFPSGVGDDIRTPWASSFTQTSDNGRAAARVLPLIKKLCETLNAQHVSYCHWKGSWKINNWLEGEGDLDLLVERADAQRFISLVAGLGFKQAEPPSDHAVPGILNFYGFDREAGRFVHLHVYYQLVIGHDLTTNYHLPIETLYLEHAQRHGLVFLPAPEFELVVFVLRKVLNHFTNELILRRMLAKQRLSSVERELGVLESKVDRERLHFFLSHLAPGIDAVFFETCVESLRPGSSLRKRTIVRKEMQRRLKTAARRPQTSDALLKIRRRITRLVTERVLHRPARKRFVNGGLLIAIVGGDGAGKTTALNALNAWLSKRFVTKNFHIGKPPRSPLTLATIGMLRIRRLLMKGSTHPERDAENYANLRFPGYLQLVRWVCAGKDRWRLYIKARRFATNGGIAFCDRFPLPQIRLMEGANIARTVEPKRRNALVRRLLELESGYYQKMMKPDLLVVLKVDPEIAVKRKTTESEHHVRRRSQELWDQDWEGSGAYVVNAGQPAEEVVAQLQSIIWAKL